MSTADAPIDDAIRIRLIGTPYHAGVRGVSMGRGPQVLLSPERAPTILRQVTKAVDVMWVDRDDPDTVDVALPMGEQMPRHVVQNWEVGRLVRAARATGRTPILSSGNCNTALGVLGGLDDDGLGMVWLDAHADASTPETSPSGLFDGMPVAVIAGRCWKAMRENIPGFHVIPDERIVSVGMHDTFPDRPPIGRIVDRAAADAVGSWRVALAAALDALAELTDRVYLHIDTDVLDPSEGDANLYTRSGGLTRAEVLESIRMVGERFDVRATNFTAYDPDIDPRMADIIPQFMLAAARNARPIEGDRS